MPGDLYDVDRVAARLEAVTSVRQVVHGLWALARAQAPNAERAVAESETYLERTRRVIDRLSSPAAEPESAAGVLHVVIGPEHGFCGPLARGVVERVPPDGPVVLVGRWLAEFVRGETSLSERVVAQLAGPSSADEIGAVSSQLIGVLGEHAAEWDISLIFPVAQGPSPKSVMLLESGRTIREDVPEMWSAPAAVLEAALTEWLAGRLAAALAEALHAEVRARLSAADKARRNCDHHAEELERALRILRQEQITGEILDLVTGQLLDDDTR